MLTSRLRSGESTVRKLLESDQIDEPVRQFLGGLDISAEASVVEVNGRRVYLVVRPAHEESTHDEPWTEEKSHRRHALIDQQIDASLTPLEVVELAELEEQFDRHLNRVAPLPIQYARDILTQLQAKIAPIQDTP